MKPAKPTRSVERTHAVRADEDHPSLATASFSGAEPVIPPLSGDGPSLPADLVDHPRYVLLEVLGRGGMGTVYKARHRLMGRLVALKVVNPGLVDRPGVLGRFRRELRAAARLLHPNIVAALDAEEVGSTHFLVTEYVEGVNLYQRLQERGRLPIEQACDCARQAALGLQHAFERGLVHRDIKPHNLMLTPQGQVKILDFGLARFVGEAAEEAGDEADLTPEEGTAAGLTPAHRGLGTPDYLAPEVARDARRADIRADIYGLGCTLYHLLGGQVPFPGGTTQEKLERHVLRTPPPVNDLRVGVPGKLARVVERMMAKNPAQRYQTPAEVARALAPFAAPRLATRLPTRR